MSTSYRAPRPCRALIAAAALVGLAGATDNRADTLRKKDGTTYEGRVVAETPDRVTFESSSGGITLRQNVARANIQSLDRVVLEGPGYCTIPLKGEFGPAIRADVFKAAVDEARRSGATIIVLDIDSPGGAVAELQKMLHVMESNRDLTFVAHVRRALSAGAITALACRHIVMAPDASIGAAVVFQVGPDGTPQNIEEKYRSAVRAYLRSAAALGGHSELWVRGMSEIDAELSVVPQPGGRPRLVEGPAPDGGRTLKKPGQILTLTAAEARDAGLSDATAVDTAAIRDVLNLKAWHDTGDSAASFFVTRARETARDEAARRQQLDERAAKLKRVQSEVAELDRRFDRAMADVTAADTAINALRARYAADAEALDAEYKRDMETARARGGPAPALAKEAARQRLAALRKKYAADTAKQNELRTAASERARLALKERSTRVATLAED